MRFVASLLAMGVVGGLYAGAARADSITFTMDQKFNAVDTTPSGFGTITFDDGGGTGVVTITMDLSGLSSSTEKIGAWYVNSAVALSASDFAFVSGSSSTVDVDATFNTNDAGFKADGDGYYDVRFDFPTSGDTFVDGDTVVWTVTHAGITAQTFNVMSAPGGGAGTYLSALHHQAIGTGGVSTWLGASVTVTTTPEPGTIFLLGAAGAALVVRRRARKRAA